MQNNHHNPKIKLNPKIRLLSIVLGAVFFGIVLLETALLKGDSVGVDTASLRGDNPARIDIALLDTTHLLEISTRRYSNGETKGVAIKYRLVDPNGNVVKEGSEMRKRKRRFVEFIPTTPGTYELYTEESMTLLGGGRGSASVRVYVNDRRVLGRLFG